MARKRLTETPCPVCEHLKIEHNPRGCGHEACQCFRTAPWVTFDEDGKRSESWTTSEKGRGAKGRFEPGNQIAVRHGAASPEIREAQARKILESLSQASKGFVRQLDEAQVHRYLTAAALESLLAEYIFTKAQEMGFEEMFASKKVTLGHIEALTRAMRNASEIAGTLGLHPSGRAKMVRDAATAQDTIDKLSDFRRMLGESEGSEDPPKLEAGGWGALGE